MILKESGLRVFLAPGFTDMRKAINGLSVLVDDLDLDPFSGHLFVFCNRRQTMVKILYWDRNGFCLWHKRLEKHRFNWPRPIGDVIGHSRFKPRPPESTGSAAYFHESDSTFWLFQSFQMQLQS